MDTWYIIYPDQEVSSYLVEMDWLEEVRNLLSIGLNAEIVGNTAYIIDDCGFEEIDWED